MMAGVVMQGLGLSVLIRVKLGTGPCSCLTQGVIRFVPISFGTAQLLCYLVTFCFVLYCDRQMIGLGTVGNMVFLGYIADFFGYIWKLVLPENFYADHLIRYLILLPGFAVFLLGAALYMTAGLGTSP